MSELDHDARALLAQAREGHDDDPSAEDRARLRAKLAAALALSTMGGTAVGAALPKSAAAQLASAGLSTKIVVASLVVATAGAAAVSWRGRGEPAEVAPRTTAAAAPSASSAQPSVADSAAKRAEVVDSAALDALDALDVPEGAPPRATKVAQRALEPSKPPSLHAELSLIAAAQQALSEGRPALALEHAAEHAARFPKGALIQERLGIDAVAACTLGERTRGLAALKKLARRAPNAPLLVRARAACRAPDAE